MTATKGASAAHPAKVGTPPLPPTRELRPLPHCSPSSASTVATVVSPTPQRPPLLPKPSTSLFISEMGATRTGYRFTVSGNCQSCMAMARDAYDKMHAEHVSAEGKASGK